MTGANGYLGQGIVRSILNNGHCVVATDFNTQFVDERAERNCLAIYLKLITPYSFFGEPDVLLQFGMERRVVHYSSAHIDDLPKHYAFIKKMVDGGIQQVAVMGSMHEIGFFEGSINESTPCHPTTPYGIAKNALTRLNTNDM